MKNWLLIFQLSLIPIVSIAQEKSKSLTSHISFCGDCYSTPLTLSKKTVNYFDSRILGTWISDDEKWIYIITQPKNEYIVIKQYYYAETSKRYLSLITRIVTTVADIDSSNFIEIDFYFGCPDAIFAHVYKKKDK